MPPHVAAPDQEGGNQPQHDDQAGDEEELEDVGHEGHWDNATQENRDFLPHPRRPASRRAGRRVR